MQEIRKSKVIVLCSFLMLRMLFFSLAAVPIAQIIEYTSTKAPYRAYLHKAEQKVILASIYGRVIIEVDHTSPKVEHKIRKVEHKSSKVEHIYPKIR